MTNREIKSAGWWLDLSGTGVKEIPEGLTVGGEVYR